MSVVQRLTAWVTGIPVLKLVEVRDTADTNSNESSNLKSSSGLANSSLSKARKRHLTSLEDEEMYAKLRDGKPFKRNSRQEEELKQLKEG